MRLVQYIRTAMDERIENRGVEVTRMSQCKEREAVRTKELRTSLFSLLNQRCSLTSSLLSDPRDTTAEGDE